MLDRLYLKEDSKVRFTLTNLIGEQIKQTHGDIYCKGFHQVEFNAPGLVTGIYVLKIDLISKGQLN